MRVTFFWGDFFWTEKLRLRQKNPDIFQKRMRKQRKIAKCFEYHAWKNKFKSKKWWNSRKTKVFKNKKSINDIFWNFCPKTKRQFTFLETQIEGW